VAGREVMLTHVLRNVMIPVITQTIAALPFLILGAVVLERLFQIPGIGQLLVESIFNQDRSVVMGIVYLTSIAYCVALLISDLLYAVVDPRINLR
jgi:peptide/nickel transport system permease protein